jgi:DNA primase
MLHSNLRRKIAERYHRALPDEIRAQLKDRGIPATIIERQLLGWNGERIIIPVFGREREVLGFRYAKVPDGTSSRPEVLSELGMDSELYGWETLRQAPPRVVICSSEFDRLVLEANGFPAVASTGGTQVFRAEWLPHFEAVKHVYVCFNRDLAGVAAARSIQRLMPRASIVTLPPDVGQSGTITDFFVTVGLTRIDFELLLAAAGASGDNLGEESPRIREFRPHHKSVKRRAAGVKSAVRLHDVVANYTELQAFGAHLIGHCPFHDDAARSFCVYPATDTYRCRVCGVEGDVLRFVMDKESMTFGQALEALERFRYTHELYGT